MKIAAVVDPIEASGLGDGNTFTIAMNAKSVEVLSKQVYSNPIAAVIREVTCNAADAHKLTGRSLSDIEVKLPTLFEPDFWVRDYGPGLSIKDVCGLYTTYFASTKDQSNDMIGGFGIGSKSPFAVSDQFTVTSWHDGFCSEFVCYKENGFPRINMIRSTPSAEHTGLKVQVAAAGTVHQWEREAEEFFKWWPEVPSSLSHIKPVFGDLNLRSTQMEGPLSKWYLLPDSTTYYVLMGGVRYQVDPQQVPYLRTLANDWRSRGNGFVFVAPLGAVSPQPSREQLNYNDATISWLEAASNSAVNELHADIKTAFAALSSLYEARVFFTERVNSVPFFSMLRFNLKWNNETPSERIYHYLDSSSSYSATEYSRPGWRTTWRSQSSTLNHSIKDAHEYKYVWLPTPPNGSHYSRIRATHPGKGKLHYGLVWGDTLANIQADLDKQGFPPNCLVEWDTLFPPLPKKPRPKRSAAVPRDLRGYPQSPQHRGSFPDAQVLLDLNTPSYWVETHAGDITDNSLRLITNFFINYTSHPITKINTSQLSDRARKQLKKAGWTEITATYFHDQPNSFFDPFILAENYSAISSSVGYLLHNYLPALPPNCTLYSHLTTLKSLLPTSINYGHNTVLFDISQFMSSAQLQYVRDQRNIFETAHQGLLAALDNYPLLPHLQLTSSVVPAIVDYLST